MIEQVVILGAGGHARVVAEAARLAGARVLAFADVDHSRIGQQLDGCPILHESAVSERYDKQLIMLANGVGSIGRPAQRRSLHERFIAMGWRFMNVIHPTSIVSSRATMNQPVQIMAGATVQIGVTIGAGSIVNSGAIIEHECEIGMHCHVAPGAVLSGGVSLGDDSHVGTNATVIQRVRLGPRTVVGAGAVVVRDHVGDACLVGVPARVQVPR